MSLVDTVPAWEQNRVLFMMQMRPAASLQEQIMSTQLTQEAMALERENAQIKRVIVEAELKRQEARPDARFRAMQERNELLKQLKGVESQLQELRNERDDLKLTIGAPLKHMKFASKKTTQQAQVEVMKKQRKLNRDLGHRKQELYILQEQFRQVSEAEATCTAIRKSIHDRVGVGAKPAKK